MTEFPSRHEFFMRIALEEAQAASAENEVPVGAVIVRSGIIVGKGRNVREAQQSCIGHAEILAIAAANKQLGSWRLGGCELYVTLEPCLMCAGALIQSRIDSVLFAAPDPKGGALQSLYSVGQDPRLNHRFNVSGGLLAKESQKLLQSFFAAKR